MAGLADVAVWAGAELERQIALNRWDEVAGGSPADWAVESHALAKAALLPSGGSVDESYYRALAVAPPAR